MRSDNVCTIFQTDKDNKDEGSRRIVEKQKSKIRRHDKKLKEVEK